MFNPAIPSRACHTREISGLWIFSRAKAVDFERSCRTGRDGRSGPQPVPSSSVVRIRALAMAPLPRSASIRRRRRWHGLPQVVAVTAFTMAFVGVAMLLQDTSPVHHMALRSAPHGPGRTLLEATTEIMLDEEDETVSPTEVSNETKPEQKATPLFPPDLFTKEQRRKGAILLHVLGMIYMFVALAIVCDEFFVPALDVIIEKLQISEDVAGATFMAAGGSAPELFTSVIGVFISFDDVGIGTIVGSAVFNILFVIAMCVLFSKTVLDLTWWPLFRDVSFYSVALLMLVVFFMDNKVYWYEALILFGIYILYCSFMKCNEGVERRVKQALNRNKVTRVCSTDQLVPNHAAGPQPAQSGGRRPSAPVLHSGTKFRHGLLQLMIHTIDPLHDGKVDEKATQLHAIASLKVLLDATKPQNGRVETYRSDGLAPDPRPDNQSHADTDDEEETKPIDLSWPSGFRKRVTYIIVAPLIIPLWLTLPDTRSPRGKKFFFVTFIGSILWIAFFSYLMVWWAGLVGEAISIPPEVMGLTVLAAGTSVPDLITSVIVARKGFGDMAVSSSVGSNLFDVTCGLPIPWLLYALVQVIQNYANERPNPWSVDPIYVNSEGMACSILLLFTMLMFVIVSIACSKWKMAKGLGFAMFFLYFVFVGVSLSFEYDVIACII
ncbi:sodium/potassium/calcium exchanger Nckx30C-like isoform X5 [Penaeus chinensis]|uniref:sodium/potassium/calcium exchanger Nckx30C-like isoform X5 n=1 Tax=Penaeus chinensis TaxID=139456 RepID=UPI001FB60BC6|nr:sodium/potassium/calcium exchanger Nckx30C-like isoform X5 [Penaeus chinensis]